MGSNKMKKTQQNNLKQKVDDLNRNWKNATKNEDNPE